MIYRRARLAMLRKPDLDFGHASGLRDRDQRKLIKVASTTDGECLIRQFAKELDLQNPRNLDSSCATTTRTSCC
jgi:hypothetical protein